MMSHDASKCLPLLSQPFPLRKAHPPQGTQAWNSEDPGVRQPKFEPPDPPLPSNETSASFSIFLSLSSLTNELYWCLKGIKASKTPSRVLAHRSCSVNGISDSFLSLFNKSLTRLSRAELGPAAWRPGAEPKGIRSTARHSRSCC